MGRKLQNIETCLICDRDGPLTRGLCAAHSLQIKRHMAKLNEVGQKELEEKLVLDGKLLPNRQGKRPGKVDPFAETVQRLIKKNRIWSNRPSSYGACFVSVTSSTSKFA